MNRRSFLGAVALAPILTTTRKAERVRGVVTPMTTWFFGNGGLEGVLAAGAAPSDVARCFTIERTPAVVPGVSNVPVFNIEGASAPLKAPAGFRWGLYCLDTTMPGITEWQTTHPALATRFACEGIHKQGLKAFTFPGNDIVWELGAVANRDQYQAFVNLNIAGKSARHADAVGVQSQGLCGDVARFTGYIKATCAQAKQAKPGIPFFGGLCANRPDGSHYTPEQLYACYQATRIYCDGYWLNVNGEPRVIADFLRLVYGH